MFYPKCVFLMFMANNQPLLWERLDHCPEDCHWNFHKEGKQHKFIAIELVYLVSDISKHNNGKLTERKSIVEKVHSQKGRPKLIKEFVRNLPDMSRSSLRQGLRSLHHISCNSHILWSHLEWDLTSYLDWREKVQDVQWSKVLF